MKTKTKQTETENLSVTQTPEKSSETLKPANSLDSKPAKSASTRKAVKSSASTQKPASGSPIITKRQLQLDMSEAYRLMTCLSDNEARIKSGITADGVTPMTREQMHNCRWICQLQAEKLTAIYDRHNLGEIYA